jgi:hypothetical protein
MVEISEKIKAEVGVGEQPEVVLVDEEEDADADA